MKKQKAFGLFSLIIVIAIIFGSTWWVSKNLDSVKTNLGLNATTSAIDLAKQAVQKIEQRNNFVNDGVYYRGFYYDQGLKTCVEKLFQNVPGLKNGPTKTECEQSQKSNLLNNK